MSESIARRYWAFLSYCHADNAGQDREWATWLHQQIERYDIPAELVGTRNDRGEVIPERIYPIFRDETSLPADADLGKSIAQALDKSTFLILLCSPRAVESRYVSQELMHFHKLGRSDRIIALIVAGEPNASGTGEKRHTENAQTLECFPDALVHPVDADGKLDWTARIEPIAADVRLPDGSEGFTSIERYRSILAGDAALSKTAVQDRVDAYEQRLQLAKLKVLAGVLGVSLDQLRNRDRVYRLELAHQATRRLRRWLGLTASLAALAVVGGIVSLNQYERAETEREVAVARGDELEDTLGFLNEQLREALYRYAPSRVRMQVIERVDGILDRMVEQPPGAAPDPGSELARARALVTKADLIRDSDQADQSEAVQFYEEAAALAAASLEVDPDNQAALVVMRDSAWSQGQLNYLMRRDEPAEALYRDALEFARRLTRLDAQNPEYRLYVTNPLMDLGILAVRQTRDQDALQYYLEARAIHRDLVEEFPDDMRYQSGLSGVYTEIGRVRRFLGDFDGSLKAFQRARVIQDRLLEVDPGNWVLKKQIAQLHSETAHTLGMADEADEARGEYLAAYEIWQQLVRFDPNDTGLAGGLNDVERILALDSIKRGDYDQAQRRLNRLIESSARLLAIDPGNTTYQTEMRDAYEVLTDLRRQTGDHNGAIETQKQALGVLQQLLDENPEHPQFTVSLARTHGKLAMLYIENEQQELALSTIEQCFEYYGKAEQLGNLSENDIEVQQLLRTLLSMMGE